MTSDGANERASSGVLRSRDLGDGRQIVARPSTDADVPAVYELYGRLSREDLARRFFSGGMPPYTRVEQWISPGRAGSALVAEVVDGDERLIVGEAGYSLLGDGDGELAITIDPDWRGGLGTWLIDILVEVAADHGVPNLHADVLLLNRPMLGVLRHRPSATVDHPDYREVRLVIATSGQMPGWAPERTKPRLLVEGVSGYWWGEQLARDVGFDVRICAGPGEAAERCPILCGDDCPLVDGADVVLSNFRADDPHGAEIVDRVRRARPDLPVTELGEDLEFAESAIELIDGLRARVDDAG